MFLLQIGKALSSLFQEAFKEFFRSENLKPIFCRSFSFRTTLYKKQAMPGRAVFQTLTESTHFMPELSDMALPHLEKFIHNIIMHVYEIQGSTHFHQNFCLFLYLFTYLITKVHTLFRFPQFYFFFLLKIPSRMLHGIYSSCLLRFLLPFLIALTFLRSVCQIFYKYP